MIGCVLGRWCLRTCYPQYAYWRIYRLADRRVFSPCGGNTFRGLQVPDISHFGGIFVIVHAYYNVTC